MSYAENNLLKDEQIVSKAEVNMVAIAPAFILAAVITFLVCTIIGFSIILLGVFALVIILKILQLKSIELALTNKKIIGKSGLINTKIMDSPLNKINNISVEQGLGGKIFGYGKIVVSTSSGAYVFNYIKGADAFRHSVMNEIDRVDEERIQKQAQELANAMRNDVK